MVAPLVPDVSAILKWVLPDESETYAREARARCDRYIDGECALLVPALWMFEVGNMVARKFPDHARAILDELCALEIPVGQNDVVWRVTRRFGVTFYNANYHAMATENRGVLVSADAKYLLASRRRSIAALSEIGYHRELRAAQTDFRSRIVYR